MNATAEQRADWLAMDHAEALIDNAQRNADDLARCNATATAMLTQGRSLEPAYMVDDALLDSDLEPTDEEIMDLIVDTFGMTHLEAIKRLGRVDYAALRQIIGSQE